MAASDNTNEGKSKSSRWKKLSESTSLLAKEKNHCESEGASPFKRNMFKSTMDDITEVNATKKDAHLSSHFSQHPFAKTLFWCTLIFTVYACFAVIFYSYVFEKWSVIDSVYYAMVTLFTVGYGDLYPTTNTGRIFTIFFALPGIVAIGIGLGMIAQVIADYDDMAREAVKGKMEERVKDLFEDSGKGESMSHRGPVLGMELSGPCCTGHPMVHAFFTSGYTWVVALLIATSLVIGHYEDWSVIESLYFFVVTATTCGYGDMTPDTQGMRLLAIFFVPLSVGLVGYVLGDVAQWYTDRQIHMAEKEFMSQELTLADLEAMDDDGNNSVDMMEFVSFMLVAMHKVDLETINELKELFNRLDVDGSGSLDRLDIIAMRRKKKNSNEIV